MIRWFPSHLLRFFYRCVLCAHDFLETCRDLVGNATLCINPAVSALAKMMIALRHRTVSDAIVCLKDSLRRAINKHAALSVTTAWASRFIEHSQVCICHDASWDLIHAQLRQVVVDQRHIFVHASLLDAQNCLRIFLGMNVGRKADAFSCASLIECFNTVWTLLIKTAAHNIFSYDQVFILVALGARVHLWSLIWKPCERLRCLVKTNCN